MPSNWVPARAREASRFFATLCVAPAARTRRRRSVTSARSAVITGDNDHGRLSEHGCEGGNKLPLLRTVQIPSPSSSASENRRIGFTLGAPRQADGIPVRLSFQTEQPVWLSPRSGNPRLPAVAIWAIKAFATSGHGQVRKMGSQPPIPCPPPLAGRSHSSVDVRPP